MLNILVPEVGLQGASDVTLVRQRVAAGVPEHVRVSLERQFGLPAFRAMTASITPAAAINDPMMN